MNFVNAFVFALAGGDKNLKAWGLADRWGWKSHHAKSAATQSQFSPTSPSSQRSQSQLTVGLPLRGATPSTPTRTSYAASRFLAPLSSPERIADSAPLSFEDSPSQEGKRLPGVVHDGGTLNSCTFPLHCRMGHAHTQC